LILVNNKTVDKPSYEVKEQDVITKVKVQEYVSRGAYKLLAAINE
jgi:predicted rRNA methylase YqxC with S4 and FtsJ domains